MPVTHEDIALLQRSMEGLGDQFYRNRALNEASKRSDIEKTLREKQLTIEQRRLDAEKNRDEIDDRREIASEDKDLLQSMIDLNAKGMMDDATREKANKVLAAHPRYGITGIQLSKPPTKPIPQSGQSSRVAELERARMYRDKAASLGPEGDLDLQKWYISAAEALENGPQPYTETEVKNQPLDPNKPTVTTRTRTPKRAFGGSASLTTPPPGDGSGGEDESLTLTEVGDMVKVRGPKTPEYPNGQTGKMPKGSRLPPGWIIVK